MLRMTNKQWAYTWPCALPVSVKLQMVMLIESSALSSRHWRCGLHVIGAVKNCTDNTLSKNELYKCAVIATQPQTVAHAPRIEIWRPGHQDERKGKATALKWTGTDPIASWVTSDQEPLPMLRKCWPLQWQHALHGTMQQPRRRA